jgi:hypothetical protein
MPWRKVKGNPSDYQYIEYNKQQFKVRWNVDAPYNLFRIWAVPSPNYYGLNLYTSQIRQTNETFVGTAELLR